MGSETAHRQHQLLAIILRSNLAAGARRVHLAARMALWDDSRWVYVDASRPRPRGGSSQGACLGVDCVDALAASLDHTTSTTSTASACSDSGSALQSLDECPVGAILTM